MDLKLHRVRMGTLAKHTLKQIELTEVLKAIDDGLTDPLSNSTYIYIEDLMGISKGEPTPIRIKPKEVNNG